MARAGRRGGEIALEFSEVGLGLSETPDDLIFVSGKAVERGGVFIQARLGVDSGAIVPVDQDGVESLSEVVLGSFDELDECGFDLLLAEEDGPGVLAADGRDAEQIQEP